MENLELRNVTMCLTKCALAAGTTTTISTTGTSVFAIAGKAYSKAALTNSASPTTDINTGAAFVGVPINKGCVFVHMWDTSGNVKVAQSELVDLDSAGNFKEYPEFPSVNTDLYAPFAYLLIQVGASGSTWTYGSSNQSGVSGVTYTRQDVITLPARPQGS